ncbi:MAG: DUF6882 domain-containing protein [Deinococcota bacterium]
MSLDIDNLLIQAYEALQQQTATHAQTWRLGEEASWSLDQEAGVLRLEFANARVAQAPVQIIGTLHQGIFQWAWANASVSDALSQHAKTVHDYGAEHDITLLTQPKLPADEDQAWQYTALASQLAGAQGAYRGHVADAELYVYMTFGKVAMSFDHTRESVPQFYERCLDVAKSRTKTHKNLWELGREQACDLDLDTGMLTITLADKRVQTPLQIVGTLVEDIFTWAWADDQIPNALTTHAQNVRDYGQLKEVSEIITPTVQASADDGWQYATLASFLARVDGVYVAQVDDKQVYVTLGELTITLTAPPIEDAAEVLELLQTYMQARFEVDKWYQDNKDSTDESTSAHKLFKDSINKAQEIYRHYWRTKNKYTLPMSVAWSSEFDLTKCHSWQCRKMRGGVQVIYAYRRGLGPGDNIINVYKFKRFEDGYKITGHVPYMSLRCGVQIHQAQKHTD